MVCGSGLVQQPTFSAHWGQGVAKAASSPGSSVISVGSGEPAATGLPAVDAVIWSWHFLLKLRVQGNVLSTRRFNHFPASQSRDSQAFCPRRRKDRRGREAGIIYTHLVSYMHLVTPIWTVPQSGAGRCASRRSWWSCYPKIPIFGNELLQKCICV